MHGGGFSARARPLVYGRRVAQPLSLYQDEVLDCYALEMLIVMDYRATPSAELTMAVDRAMRPFAKRQTDGVAMLALVRPTVSGFPDAASRRATNEIMTEMKPLVRFRAGVVEGAGVVPTLVRTFFGSMTALLGDTRTSRTFRSVDDAIEWLGPLVRERWPWAALEGSTLATTIYAQRRAWDRALPPR